MRPRAALCALALVTAWPAAADPLAPQDAEDLAAALHVLSKDADGEAAAQAGAVLGGPTLGAADLVRFFTHFFSQQPLTTPLARFLGDSALTAPGSARRALQDALCEATTREIDAMFRAYLPDRFPALVSDETRIESLRASMTLLGRIAAEGDALSATARRASYEQLRGLIAVYPQVLRKSARIDVEAQPRLALLRAQLYKHLQDLLVPFDREKFILDTGFAGAYAEIVRNHGVLVLDDDGLDPRQLRAIAELLALIPPPLHRTAHISVYDLLGNRAGDQVWMPLAGSAGVNILSFPIEAGFDDGFPRDVEGVAAPTFCTVLQHELNHMVDHDSVSGDPSRRRRRDALIAQAGNDPTQYLRSMLPPGFFVANPQEFFASVANEYFTDSFQTLLLAVERFEGGAREPLNQFLFFADVYSQGGDTTLFVRQTSECEFSLHVVPIGRDERGHVDRIQLPDTTLRFVLDERGNVVP